MQTQVQCWYCLREASCKISLHSGVSTFVVTVRGEHDEYNVQMMTWCYMRTTEQFLLNLSSSRLQSLPSESVGETTSLHSLFFVQQLLSRTSFWHPLLVGVDFLCTLVRLLPLLPTTILLRLPNTQNNSLSLQEVSDFFFLFVSMFVFLFNPKTQVFSHRLI